jgi:hypothetical protein
MVNNFTNINKANDHLSPEFVEHTKQTTTHGAEDQDHGLGETQQCGGLYLKYSNSIFLFLIISKKKRYAYNLSMYQIR